MGRGVIGMCGLVGSVVGSYVPTVWGASSLGVQSLFVGAIGAVIGVVLGARIAES
jgi:uncharacterized membrane protein YeaQ/YmgE (transglycosylase-associated protein family)